MAEAGRRVSALPPDRLRRLMARLGERDSAAGGSADIPLADRGRGALPASYGQERLWFLDRFAAQAGIYQIAGAVHLRGPLATTPLAAALRAVVRRHEALRTTLAERDGRLWQTVGAEVDLAMPLLDLSRLPAATSAGEAARLAREQGRRPFDLATGPLVRTSLLRRASDDHLLLLSLHHAVADGWSLGVLAGEVATLYQALAAGRPSQLPELSIQYADYAVWERERFQSGALASELAFWRERLDGLPPLELPADRPRPATPSFRGALATCDLGEETRALQSFARDAGATIFMALLALLDALLLRYSGQSDFGVGTAIANRNRRQVEALIGLFANTLVLRVDLSGRPSFAELVRRAREATLEAFARQELPFDRLVEELRPERDPARNPFCQVLVTLQNQPWPPLRIGELEVGLAEIDTGTARADLALLWRERQTGLTGTLEYSTDLFERASAERMLRHLAELARAGLADPDQDVWELSLFTAGERRQVLDEWHGTAVPYPRMATVQQLFAEQAYRSSDRVAVVAGDTQLTYGELAARASRLAHRLRHLDVGPETLVSLALPRSPEAIVGLLGILEAGGAYQPLDPAHPRERLAALLEEAQPRALVTVQSLLDRLPAGLPTVCLDRDSEAPAAEPGSTPAGSGGATADNLIYVMYTSGSTGRPKGVAVTHRAVVRLVRGADYARIDAGEVFLHLAPLAFDASTLEIWGPLCNGGRLVLAPDGPISLRDLGGLLTRHGVTTLFLTTGLFNQMVDEGIADLRGVAQLLTGGEVTSPSHVRRALAGLPDCNLVIAYGPTENTTFTTCYPLAPEAARQAAVPIGRPIANTSVYVLDREGRPVPPGIPGELHAGGDGLARGYLGRPELTAERFVPNPWSGRRGDRSYRTGDLARWRADGALDFLARIDRQVKIRGFRVEPGEIEAALAAHPAVAACAVTVRGRAGEERSLAAWFAMVPGVAPGAVPAVVADELRAWLATRLPAYMVPATLTVLPALPLTPSGKIDRQALARLQTSSMEPDAAGHAAPETALERRLAALWSEVLGRRWIGRHDDFFALGGHSLMATRVVARLRQDLGVELPLIDLFTHPTVAGLAAAVADLERRRLTFGESLIPAAAGDAAPLSFAQERLWLLEQIEPGGASYNVPAALRLGGSLDPAALAACFATIARRHAILRTTFTAAGGEVRQRIAPPGGLELPLVDLAELPPDLRRREVNRLTATAARAPFDLAAGPVLRIVLVRLAPEEHRLLLNLHHIVADGWSLGVLAREVATLYGAAAAGRPSSLPELPIQYADYALWERRRLQGAVLEDEIAFWRQRLDGMPPLELATDHPRPAAPSWRGALASRDLPAASADALLNLAHGEGATLFMALLALFDVLLMRYSGQTDFGVGAAVAHRDRREVEGLIGLFVNTLVLRVDLSGRPGFAELLRRVRDVTLAAFAHAELPFGRLVEALRPVRAARRNPLFEVLFTLQNQPWPPLRMGDLDLELLEVDTGTTRADLTLTWRERNLPEGALTGTLEYSTELFERASAERMLGHLAELLDGALAEPERNVWHLPLLSPAERRQILGEWRGAASPYPRQATVHDLVAEQAARAGERVAIEAGAERLTYAELAARAHHLACRLRRLGVGPEALVAVAVPRSPATVIALLAVLEAGGAYLPLDPSLPRARLAALVEEARPRALITCASLSARLPGGLPTLCMDRDHALPAALAAEPGPAAAALAVAADAALADTATADNLAYVLFTSGSTGSPKGVAVPHRAVVRLVRGADYARLDAEQVFLQLAPLGFDASTLEIWGALCNGGRLVLPPPEIPSLEEIGRWLVEHGVTTLWLTAGLFHQMVDEQGDALAGLTQLLAGGDVLSPLHVRRAAALLRHGVLINGYGPTENTTFTCCYRVPPEQGPPAAAVPIGRPIANTAVYLLDRQGGPVPVGVPGELHAAGDGLARGYLGRPDLTAERFVPNPCANHPGERLYRTGDLARWRPDGMLEFLGRIDRQVKIRGFRVEPEEVETVLATHPGVAACAVVLRGAPGAERVLVAWLVAATDLDPAALRGWLFERLPSYMVPAVFAQLPALPLAATGKVDRQALARLEPEATDDGGSGGEPATPLERRLAALWSEVLGRRRIGRDDDFFALGGHSLLATRMVARLRQELGVELPVRRFFDAPTIARLAATISATAELAAGAAVVPPVSRLPRPLAGDLPLSFPQERLWFLDRIEPGTPAYNVPGAAELTGALDVAALATALRRVVARHETLRTVYRVVAGEPRQRVLPHMEIGLPLVDLESLPAARRPAAAERLATGHAHRRFDLERGPLLAAALLRLSRERHRLFVVFHHVICDGWSIALFVRELGTLYAAGRSGPIPSLPELPIQYADYAAWQRGAFAGTWDAELAYWVERLGGEVVPLELPADRPRPAVQTYRGGQAARLLPPALLDRLMGWGRAQGATLFMTLLAAIETLLHRHSGQHDLLIGAPVAGRRAVETENLIGCFLNTLVLRCDLSGTPSFRDLVARARATTLAAYSHQDVPFEAVLARLPLPRDLSRTPLFQVMVNLLNLPSSELRLPGLAIADLAIPALPSKLDMTFYARATTAGLQIELVYNAEVFDRARMEEILDQLALLLDRAPELPDQPVGALPLVTAAARAVLPDPAAPLPATWTATVHERFAEHARQHPERTALADRDGTCSYGDLEIAANRLGWWLHGQGVGRGDLVAIFAHRSATLAQALLGTLKAGAAFTIVDPAYPAARSIAILTATAPRALLHLEAAGPLPAVVEAWLHGTGCPTLGLPGDGSGPALARVALSPRPPPTVTAAADDPAHLVFTSGSTGSPKGVLASHRPLSHFLAWHCQRFGLGESDRFSLLSGLAHDPLLRDLFTPLVVGATLCVPEPEVLLAPGRLSRWMQQEAITVAHLTPALSEVLTEAPGPMLEALRFAFIGGDVLTRNTMERLRRRAPRCRPVVYYGATETPQGMGYHVVGEHERERIPLGRGIEGVQLLVLNPAGQLAGVGELGEISVRTPYLATGYWRDEELTRRRFVVNPATGSLADRVYLSGDLGRYLPDGEVELAGRADLQVKIRGYRVEPGEVEAVIAAMPGVREAVVVSRQEQGEPRLVAWVVASGEREPSAAELRAWVQQRLPAPMVPSGFATLPCLPLTANGKVNRRALAELAGAPEAAPATAARTPLEQRLAALWCEVLGRETVGVHDDFFALGGHSLLATRLVFRLEQALGEEIGLRSLFAWPTVAGLASEIERRRSDVPEGARSTAGSAPPCLLPAPADRHLPFPLTDLQQAYWVGRSGAIELGNVASHRYLESEAEALDLDRFERAWQRLIDRHDMLRAVFLPDARQQILPAPGPYRIAVEDLRRQAPAPVVERLAELRRRMSHQSLPIDRWPLFEIRACLLPGGRVRLFVSFDYLIADAWSFGILIRELARAYSDSETPLGEPLELSFRDYVLAAAARHDTERFRRSQEYWRGRLADLPPGPELPLVQSAEALSQQRFERRAARLEPEAWSRLKQQALAAGITSAGLLLSAFAEVLATWSKTSRFTIVLTLFNRPPVHREVEKLVGDFTSTILVAVERSAGAGFKQRAQEVQRQLWTDLDHRHMSGVEVLRELARFQGVPARAASPVVFTSTLDLETAAGEAPVPELPLLPIYGVSQTPQVLLDHQASERQGALQLNWDAVEARFPEGLLDAMFGSYQELLRRLAAGASAWEEPIAAAIPARQLARHVEVNSTAAPVPRGLLHEPCLRQAAHHPERPAVVSPERSLTYVELVAQADRVARLLRDRGARPETLVAVVMEKGWEQVVAALGILRAGAAYLPFDPALPTERLWYLLRHAEVRTALTQPQLLAELSWPAEVEIVPLDGSEDAPASAPLAGGSQDPDDLAYVIFTSGSTGLPKGVMIDHRGALNTIVDVNRRFRIGAEDRVLALSALTFDLSVYDLFGMLAAGGTIVLPAAAGARQPAHWLELMQRYQVTVWNSVPALMEMLVHHVEQQGERLPRALRLVLLSGDWVPVDLPQRIRELAPGTEVVSLGGATEASIWSILYPIAAVDRRWRSVPYGMPMINQTVQVLDELLAPRPDWVPGQLYIGGVGLARGYWRDQERTAASFFCHPRTGERLYRTGDLGRYLPDGNIEFLGREDFQVKVQGHRIELGEIEAALAQHPAVRAAVVDAPGEPGNRSLAAYVVADQPVDAAGLQTFLGGKLPAYMVPPLFVFLDELPLTANGKVDRRALPEPGSPALAQLRQQAYVAPSTPLEEMLTAIFAEVLEVEKVGVQDHFFACGGNSLKAILLISRIRQELDVELPMDRLFRDPTAAGLGLAILEAQGKRIDSEEMTDLLAELEDLSDEEIQQQLTHERGVAP